MLAKASVIIVLGCCSFYCLNGLARLRLAMTKWHKLVLVTITTTKTNNNNNEIRKNFIFPRKI